MSNSGRWTMFVTITALFAVLGCFGCRHNVCSAIPECVGPDLTFYGHKKTCWHSWPNSEWSQWPCGDELLEEAHPPTEELVPPNAVHLEPVAYWQPIPVDTTVSPVPSAMPQNLPAQPIPFSDAQLPVVRDANTTHIR